MSSVSSNILLTACRFTLTAFRIALKSAWGRRVALMLLSGLAVKIAAWLGVDYSVVMQIIQDNLDWLLASAAVGAVDWLLARVKEKKEAGAAG